MRNLTTAPERQEYFASIRMPLCYKEIIESNAPYKLLYGGRVGGKSNNTAILAILSLMQNLDTDIVVARVSYGSLADSSYAEIEHAINSFESEKVSETFVLKKSPLRIERKDDRGTIYFIGYGGSNTSRTKSIRPKHKIKIIILEETQELREKRNLDEALASLRRHWDENASVFILGNPPPQEAHWFNVYIEQSKQDPDYLVKNLTWQDIVPFINDYDLKEILKIKNTDPNYYEWFYMGKATGGYGSVYPMFRKEKHIITVRQFDMVREKSNIRIVGCVIGGDGAVTHDATAFVPQLLLNNGQCVIGPIFYHNPREDGIIGYHKLVQDHLTRWFDELCKRFFLGTRQELREHPNSRMLPIWMRIDSAAPDLIQECRFFFGDRVQIAPIKKASVMEMVGVVQSSLSNDNIVIIDYGGYFDYQKNMFIKRDTNLLAEQLSMLIWNETQTNYDPIIPNDVADAFTYGDFFWYSNQENIQYFNIIKMKQVSNLLISDIINDKK